MNNAWLQYAVTSNRFRPTYIQGFLDVSGNAILRGGSLSIKTGSLYLNQGDISMNGNIATTGSLNSGVMTVDGNARIKNSVQIDNDASVMSSLGVGKVANDSYPLDVSGIARFSSSINVNGAATLASISNVAGASRFTGNVGIGTSAPTSDYILLVNGKTRTTDTALFDNSVSIGTSIDPATKATLYVKDSLATDASNSVILDVPNTLYTSIDYANNAQVNSLEVDTQNRVIKPYRKYEGDLITDPTDGWDLGAAGAYSFNRVYGRTMEVSEGIGIGTGSSPSYAVDVVGSSRLSGGLTVTGGTSLSSITDVTGTSKFSGRVGFGKVASATNAVDISGNARISGNVIFESSLVINQTTQSTAALRVTVPYNSAIANSVELEVPNVLYKSTSSTNPSQTNFLEIDTKTRSIKPYAMEGATMLNSASTGWNLGGPGANRFNTIYGRDLQISTNTIKIEDDSGNQISMGFDAATGAVNYTVTTISGEVFVIKGVQTQKISSGNGTIDPSLFEFTGLTFGDTFVTDGSYNLASTFTYNLGTTTYTGNGTYFSNSVNPQSLISFTTGQNLSTLLLNIPSGTSVVIKVGTVDGRTSHLEGIDTAGSLVSLENKIISVNKTGTTVKWTLWNSDNYQNVSGNFLHYIELKNINMANGTYYIAKTTGTVAYNIVDSQYLTSGDLSAVNGDLYLFVNRGPGKNWTKVPVSLPMSGSIQTQHLADSAVSTAKLANNSVTGYKIAAGSISGLKITDNSITSDKIAEQNVSTAKIADAAITSAKLASGAINSAALIVDGTITGAKLVAGTIGATLLDASAVTIDKLATGSVVTSKLADSAVTTTKIADGSISAAKMATDSIGSTSIISGAITGAKLATGAITGDKILDGTITAVKLAAGVITGSLLDASSVTMDKVASGAISTEKLADLSVVSSKLAASAVTTAKIVDLAVTDTKLAALAVIESKVATGAITVSKIAANAVTVDKIVDGSISTGKLADSAVIASKINTSAVTVDKLASSSVTTAKLADYAVTSIKIANSAIDANQINDLAVSTAKLAAGAVTTDKIGSAQVVAASIATDAIITDKILAGAVTTAKIASGAITTSLLDASAVSTDKIAMSAVTTAKIADAAVTTAKLNSSSVTTSIIADGSITAAKLAVGFVLPSGAGGGSTINSASDISVNSIQVNGKAKFERLSLVQQVVGTSTVYANTGYYIHERYTSSMISLTGDTIVASISQWSNGLQSRIYSYKYNSTQGKFILTTDAQVSLIPHFMGMSDDGNVVATAASPRFSAIPHLCYLIRTVGSVTTPRIVHFDVGEGINNVTYVIRGINVSGDGTKFFIVYSDTGSYGGTPALWGVHVYNVSDLSLLVKIPMQTNFPFYVNDNYGDVQFRIDSSRDGTRLILGSMGYSGNLGRVMVFNITYSQTTSVVAMDVTNNTNPSYGLTGYKPLKLSDLPTRFRLRVNSNQFYVGQSTTSMFSFNSKNYVSPTPISIFTADKPSDLYSTTGVDTYRLRVTNYAWNSSTNSATNFYLYSNGTSDITINSTYATTLNFAWQFFKNTSTGEIIMWNPYASGSGNYITYNSNQTTGDTFRLGAGTPIKFTIEPVFDFSSVNTVTTIGTFDGTTTSGVTSRYGYRNTISSDGSKIAFSSGDITTTTAATQAIRLYTYVSGTNWTLNQTILASSVTDVGTKPIGGFGTDIRFNTAFTVMVIGSINNISGNISGYLSIYKLTNGSWVYDKSVNGANLSTLDGMNTFGYCVSVSDNGYYLGSDRVIEYGNIYVYKVLVPDLTSNIVSAGSVYSNSLVTDALTLNGASLNLTAGSDVASTYSYGAKNTGTFLNSGNMVIHNPTTPLVPTLTLKTTGSGGASGLGPIIEFKNSASTSTWGEQTSVYDYRWKFDNYNGYQTMMFEQSYRDQGNGNVYRNQILTLNHREICVGSPITSPASTAITLSPGSSGTYYGGSFVFNSASSVLTTDWTMYGSTAIRILWNGGGSGNLQSYYGVLQCVNSFEIQTGTTASLSSANYATNRRLHIASTGEVGIGTTAVSGTKMTVAGDVCVSGNVSSLKHQTVLSYTYVGGNGTLNIGGQAELNSVPGTMSLSGSGNTIIMLAGTNNQNLKNVQILKRNPSTNVWDTSTTTFTNGTLNFVNQHISGDGNTIFVSRNQYDATPQTGYFYRYTAGSWVLQTQIVTSYQASIGFFSNILLSYDGSKMYSCGYSSSSPYTFPKIYVYNTVTCVPLIIIDLTEKGINLFSGDGLRNGFSSNGNTISSGNLGTKIYVWDINYSTSAVTETQITTPISNTQFTALSANGCVLMGSMGSRGQNYARIGVWQRASVGASWNLIKTIAMSDFGYSGNGYYFGTVGSFGISDDGTVIGAVLNESGICKAGYWKLNLTDGTSSAINIIDGSVNVGTSWGKTGFHLSADGGVICVYSPTGGRIEIYNSITSTFQTTKNLNVNGTTNLSLSTDSIDRMTINNSGAIGIGTTPVTGVALTISGTVTATGTITGSSDDRLKENEVLINDAMDTIMKLRPEIYDKKPDFTSTDTSTWQKETGIIAQDIWYGAPELRHLIQLGTHLDVSACYYESIEYPPMIPGVDVSGVQHLTVNMPFITKRDASGNILIVDASDNPFILDLSGNPIDASGNRIPPTTQVLTIDNRPKMKQISKIINMPVNPANIVDIPLAPDIQLDPDYTALGWGDTPASVNYIGLIPYLIKSIQELKAESDAQKERIRVLENL